MRRRHVAGVYLYSGSRSGMLVNAATVFSVWMVRQVWQNTE